jgi:hypothetical protein
MLASLSDAWRGALHDNALFKFPAAYFVRIAYNAVLSAGLYLAQQHRATRGVALADANAFYQLPKTMFCEFLHS